VHICLIANQIAAWRKIGGFGTATRAIGAGLVRRGLEVSAVVPRRKHHGQGRVESLDGITVHGIGAWETLTSGAIFRRIRADIYHSQEPNMATWLAQRAVPEARHVVTCRDPRGFGDHLQEFRYSSPGRQLMFPGSWLYEMNPLVKRAVRDADAVFCPAPMIAERARRLYGGGIEPEFVPSPVDLPDRAPRKSPTPEVLFVGRWDRRKRIERFFELAQRFPKVHFTAVGEAHDASYDRHLRECYGKLANLEMPGLINRFGNGGLYDLYERSWVIVNTSIREGLPYTFVEAAAWGCSILSELNPERFAERFGCVVEKGDYDAGLRWLLADGNWHRLGLAAAEYVHETFSEESSISEHIRRYEALLADRRRRPHLR
jgi:glycosyltransferase involved in cell wall biosynthesis